MGCLMLANSNEPLGECRAKAPTAQPSEAEFILDALTSALQIAFEHAVFLNRFEIDEQEPLSRLHALTEQLVLAANSLPSNGSSEGVATKATIISVICVVSTRVRATIQRQISTTR